MHTETDSPPGKVRVFLDETPYEVPRDTVVRDLVALANADDLSLLDKARAYVTDGVGRQIDATVPVFAGAIYRLVRSAPRRQEPGT